MRCQPSGPAFRDDSGLTPQPEHCDITTMCVVLFALQASALGLCWRTQGATSLQTATYLAGWTCVRLRVSRRAVQRCPTSSQAQVRMCFAEAHSFIGDLNRVLCTCNPLRSLLAVLLLRLERSSCAQDAHACLTTAEDYCAPAGFTSHSLLVLCIHRCRSAQWCVHNQQGLPQQQRVQPQEQHPCLSLQWRL